MKLVFRLMVALGCACLLVSNPASAFSIATVPSSVQQGGSVTLTLSGTSTGLRVFSVDVDPDENVLQFVSSDEYPVAGTSSSGPPVFDSTLGIASFLLLSDDGVTPFNLGGALFDITFLACSTIDPITLGCDPSAPLVPLGPTTVTFTICATADHCNRELDQLGIPGYTDPFPLRATINITARDGNIPVPEPASIWLAMAALVAGGLVFRNNKDSKRS